MRWEQKDGTMKSTPTGMNEVVWADRPHEVLTNGHPEMNAVQSARHIATRSQDDAMVGYFFQRPQTDPDFQNYGGKQSRWALGDDSVLEVRGTDNSELESDFQALALETGHPLEYSPAAKKLWGVEETKPDDSKGILFGDQWRDTAWSTGHNSASDTGGLGVKMVEYVLGSSPTSKDLDNRMSRLHLMNTTDPSEKLKKLKSLSFDGDMKVKEQEGNSVIHQSNGIMQNGLGDEGGYHHSTNSRQSSPSEDIGKKHMLNEKIPKHTEQMIPSSSGTNMPPGGGSLGPLDQGFEGVGMDSLQFDYSTAFMHSIDSPTTLDYSSQAARKMIMNRADDKFGASGFSCTDPQHFFMEMYSRGQGQPMPVMGQQQFPMQQQGQMQAANPAASPAPFASSPYVMNQDPYAATAPMGTLMPGPAMMPQYYGMPPWGMFPTPGMVQGGQGQNPTAQQQLMRGGGARPMTPQGPGGDAMSQGGGGMPQGMQGPGGQYPVMAPPYYDQNGSMMMSNGRGMGAAMRLVPPVLVNPAAPNNNPGTMSNGGLRLLGSQGQQNPTASLFSNGTPNSNTMYTSPANSNLSFSHPNSGLGFSGTSGSSQLGYGSGLGLGPAQPQNTMGYGSSSMGPIGTSLSAIGTSIGGTTGSPRRDSFDRRDGTSLGTMAGSGFSGSLESQLSRQMAQQKGNQFYGPLGSVTASGPGPIGMLPPSQSLTPPPSLNGSLGNINLGALGGRLLSAAPGAEAKYMIRNGPIGNNVFGSSNTLFPNRTLQRSSSLEKPTGRSRLLEDFRNNRYPNLQLRDLANHIVEFSQDQHGSRFIQQKLERATPAEKQLVFNEILGSAYSLMTDVFGNYVIQKFFEFGTTDQKQALAQKVKGHVLPLALQMYGCRVIQKALESIPPEQQQKEIVKELDGHVLKCVKDQNGNHVVQKCIECVDPIALQFIINAFQGQVFSLSTHPYGCRVIQRILEHCTPEQTTPILEELHQHTEQLVQDQYGNYVVQHVLEHGCQDDKSKIVSVVRGKVLTLSQHKFASNVVEKCVTHASRAERAVLIEEVCTYTDGPHSALYVMMKDQYANYVVQRMIEVAETPQRKLLLHKIRPHIPSLRKYTYGKHILAKLEKYLLKNNDLGPIGAPPNGAI